MPEGDPLALANALRQVLDNPELRQTLAANGRALIEREFNQHVNAARLREVFNETIANGVPPLRRSA